ncbi:MAG: hypothetical protein RLZZ414_752, partial [Bacteroidota bacterium]
QEKNICSPNVSINLRNYLYRNYKNIYFVVNGVTVNDSIIYGKNFSSSKLNITANSNYNGVITSTPILTIDVLNDNLAINLIPNQCPSIQKNYLDISSYINNSTGGVLTTSFKLNSKTITQPSIIQLVNNTSNIVNDTIFVKADYGKTFSPGGTAYYTCNVIVKTPIRIYPKPAYTFNPLTSSYCFKSGEHELTKSMGLVDAAEPTASYYWYSKRVRKDALGKYYYNTDSLKTNPTTSLYDTLYFKGESQLGCYNDSARYIVSILNKPTINGNFNDTLMCKGSTIPLFTLSSPTPAGGVWSGINSEVTKSGQSYLLNVNNYIANTINTITYTGTSFNGCSNSRTKKIYLKQNPRWDSTLVTSNNAKNYFCLGDTLKLKASVPFTGKGAVNFKWYKFQNGTPFSTLDSTKGLFTSTYTFFVTNTDTLSKCESNKSRFTFLMDSAKVNIKTDSAFIRPNSLVTIYSNPSSNVIKWEWTFNDGRKSVRQNPKMYIYNPNDSLSCTLRITTLNGCVRNFSSNNLLITKGSKLGIITGTETIENSIEKIECYNALDKIICPNVIESIEVFNSSGVMVYQSNNFNKDVYQIEDFPSGLYLVKYISNNKLFTQKLIK